MVNLRNVTKKYGSQKVVDSVNLDVADGQFVVLIGTSGCGKTTTLRMINRLIEPTAGQILIDGRNIAGMNPVELRRNIGYVIQQIGLFPNMTVLENIEAVPRLLKWPHEKSRARALELMEMAGMDPDDFSQKYPGELSGGQQQRIGVLRALAAEPSLVLMDEPFGALDPITRDSLQDELKKLHHTLKKTFIFVTHDMSEAVKMADVIVFMDHGQIVQTAPPEEILEHPANDFVRNFIGRHAATGIKEMTVPEVMRKNPVTVTGGKKTLECISLMSSKGIDSLIVTTDDGVFQGIVTIGDIRKAGKPGQAVGSLANPDALTVPVSGTAKDAFDTLTGQKAEYLVVLDGENRVVGIVTRTGMVKSMAEALWGGEDL